ncbi:unnamed protein product, partial [Urochloa humidicola]
CPHGGSRAAGASGRGEEGAPELGKAAGRREAESAAARREGELRRRILRGRTRRRGRDDAVPLSSVWSAAAGLNCCHPNRCSSSPRRSKPAATQIEAIHAAPPPPASRPAACHEPHRRP